MRLSSLLESASRRDALELQQTIIDACDFEVNAKLILRPTSDVGILRLTFPAWQHSNDNFADVDFKREGADDISVGIEGLGRSHLFIRGDTGTSFKSLSDPDIGEVIKRECCRRVGISEKVALGERAKWYAEKAKYKGINNMPDSDDFTPFHYAPRLTGEQEVMIGDAALKGKEVVCMAIRKPDKDVLGGSDALNKFNDEVLRKAPRPKQLAMATTTDLKWFLYAPQ